MAALGHPLPCHAGIGMVRGTPESRLAAPGLDQRHCADSSHLCEQIAHALAAARDICNSASCRRSAPPIGQAPTIASLPNAGRSRTTHPELLSDAAHGMGTFYFMSASVSLRS